MAAKSILNNVKSPLGHFLRSSALTAVRIAAIQKPLAETEALRRSLFDSKARGLVGDGRLWALNSDSFHVQARESRRVVEHEEEDEDSDDDFDGEVDFGDDDDEDEDFEDSDDDDERR